MQALIYEEEYYLLDDLTFKLADSQEKEANMQRSMAMNIKEGGL